MNIDATFWVAISFIIFIGLLFYLKVPQKIINSLEKSRNQIWCPKLSFCYPKMNYWHPKSFLAPQIEFEERGAKGCI